MQLSYQFQIATDSGQVVSACTQTVTPDSGAGNVTYTPACGLEFDALHKWKVRARNGDYVGPWSAEASFKTPSGGYISGNEVFDPLTNGKTAGELNGPVQFISGEGAKLLDHNSFIRYRLPVNLQQGEFSMMIKGADEGSEGDKSKVFAMQEGPDEGDITDDDYRFTAELRGANYGAPGSVTYPHHRGRWCLARRRPPAAELQQLAAGISGNSPGRPAAPDSKSASTVQTARRFTAPAIGTGSHPYRPDPHYLYLGVADGTRRCARRNAARRHLQERLGVVATAARRSRTEATGWFVTAEGKGTNPLPSASYFAFLVAAALPW